MGGSFSSPTTNVPETAPTTGAPEPINRASNSSPEPDSRKFQPNPKGAEEKGEEQEEEEEDEEGECGFCLFMKAGNCKEVFIDWQMCVKKVEDGKEEVETKCSEVSAALFKCMEAHRDQYAAILGAKEKFDEEATIEAEGTMDSEKKEGSTKAVKVLDAERGRRRQNRTEAVDVRLATEGLEKNVGSKSQED